MRDGRIDQFDTPRELFERPRTPFVADFLGAANFLPGTVQQQHRRAHRGALDTGGLLQGPPAGGSGGRPGTGRGPARPAPAVYARRRVLYRDRRDGHLRGNARPRHRPPGGRRRPRRSYGWRLPAGRAPVVGEPVGLTADPDDVSVFAAERGRVTWPDPFSPPRLPPPGPPPPRSRDGSAAGCPAAAPASDCSTPRPSSSICWCCSSTRSSAPCCSASRARTAGSTLHWYADALQGTNLDVLLTTLRISAETSLLSLVIGFLLAYCDHPAAPAVGRPGDAGRRRAALHQRTGPHLRLDHPARRPRRGERTP